MQLRPKTSRVQLLDYVVYQNYVRPYLRLPDLVFAERRLMEALDYDFNDGINREGSTLLVRRHFDRAWKRALHEWHELRDGRQRLLVPRTDGEPAVPYHVPDPNPDPVPEPAQAELWSDSQDPTH